MKKRKKSGGRKAAKEYLDQIKELHLCGCSSVAIGIKLGRDHSTILSHLHKMGFRGKNFGGRPRTDFIPLISCIRTPPKVSSYENGYRLNEGKSYAEYFREDKRYAELLKKGGYFQK